MTKYDVYNCKLYNLILNQHEKLKRLVGQNDLLLRDLKDFNFKAIEKHNKISEQLEINSEEIKAVKKQIGSFNHCRKCKED